MEGQIKHSRRRKAGRQARRRGPLGLAEGYWGCRSSEQIWDLGDHPAARAQERSPHRFPSPEGRKLSVTRDDFVGKPDAFLGSSRRPKK